MKLPIDKDGSFRLSDSFVEPYSQRQPHWGFGALSWIIFKRTYSRNNEEWWQTCRRVIEGMFTVQRIHCLENGRPWDAARARDFAQNAYDRLWHFKWTPPGRGLWIMGTDFMYERGGAALNNCGFVSTGDIAEDYAAPFLWMLRMSMLGVGVGFDTRGKGCLVIQTPAISDEVHPIADSREGWANALERLLRAYTGEATLPRSWDYSQIRPEGSQLHSFGGRASGPEPLRNMLDSLVGIHQEYVGRKVDSRLLVDAMNIVGRCVVAGGIRRSAQIAFGDPDDTQFIDLKTNQQKLREYRWVSNNSVFARAGMDYSQVAERTVVNGEPGYLWLDNIRAYGRMADPPDWADHKAVGSNPCVEQTLWNKELCCLVETYPYHHDSLDDYRETLRVAYQYAKTVTLVPTQDEVTNQVMMRNRRIGCSMTGVVQAINSLGRDRFYRWCDEAYGFVQHLDAEYAEWLGIPRSIKTTSVKPSGTVSLLAGATPGVHWDHAPYYIRRVRVSENHPIANMCREAGYDVEEDFYSENTAVISFPVHVENVRRSRADVPVREKVELAVKMQEIWSDNQVSCTADFDPDTEKEEIPRLLRDYESRLKAIVFLPTAGHGYAQPPYETITEEQYKRMTDPLQPLCGTVEHEEEHEARFCDGRACELG